MTTPANTTGQGSGGAGRGPQQQPMLGRFALVREIARSNDIVWEGRDTQMNRRVAIKELALGATLTGQARRERIERFYREARAAGAMSHSNIVTIYDVGEDKGRYFIAMEYLEGQTLRDRITTGGPLPLSEAVAVTSALCDALEYAHQRGVVHRDIKPDNVHMLPGGRVKLTDFGIARIQHEEQLTVAGQVFGTPSYMSPEQVIGKTIDARSDIFSLGIMLYEMLTGRKPFTGDSVVTITYRIMNDPTPPAVGATPSLEAVIHQATAKNPAERFQSATAMRDALTAAAANGTGGFTSTTAPPLYATPLSGAGVPPQMTAQYGSQTRQAVAPGHAAPMSPVAPPVAYAYPQEQQTPNRAGQFATVFVSLLVVGAVALGGGWALSQKIIRDRGGSSSSGGVPPATAVNPNATTTPTLDPNRPEALQQAEKALDKYMQTPGYNGTPVTPGTVPMQPQQQAGSQQNPPAGAVGTPSTQSQQLSETQTPQLREARKYLTRGDEYNQAAEQSSDPHIKNQYKAAAIADWKEAQRLAPAGSSVNEEAGSRLIFTNVVEGANAPR